MEKAKIRPLATPKPLNRSSQKWQARLRLGRHPACIILYRSVQGFLFSKYVILPSFGVTSFFFVFLGSSIRLQPTPLKGFLRNTSNDVVPGKEVPFEGSVDYILYLDP